VSRPASSPIGRWLVRRGSPALARLRLFCFAHAGGAASTFRDWPAELPPAIDVCAIQLPGREGRIAEEPLTSLAATVPAVAGAIRPLLDVPFAFFGHSMGGLIAFELARELRRTGAPQPSHLLVSGRRAPTVPTRKADIHALPTPEFLRAIRDYDGTPAEVFENEQLLELILPVLRADLTLTETYTYQPGPPLGMPVSAFYGREDPTVTAADADAWRHQTTGAFRIHELPGGHFFLQTAQQQLLLAISEDLAPLLLGR